MKGPFCETPVRESNDTATASESSGSSALLEPFTLGGPKLNVIELSPQAIVTEESVCPTKLQPNPVLPGFPVSPLIPFSTTPIESLLHTIFTPLLSLSNSVEQETSRLFIYTVSPSVTVHLLSTQIRYAFSFFTKDCSPSLSLVQSGRSETSATTFILDWTTWVTSVVLSSQANNNAKQKKKAKRFTRLPSIHINHGPHKCKFSINFCCINYLLHLQL